MKNSVLAVLSQALLVSASYNYNADTDQVRFWMNDGGDDFEMAEMPSLSGRGFASLDIRDCFKKDDSIEDRYDIAILGAPHDATTTGRPGARFGPFGIRTGSNAKTYGYDIITKRNALHDWAKIVDCGDAQLTWLDNRAAIKSLDKAHRVISGRPAASADKSTVPRIVTLGGDHTTTLSALRSTHKHWGPVSVIHFDSHIDTWDPTVLGGGISDYASLNHGTFLHFAHEEGLIRNTSIHAGLRAPLIGRSDLKHDRHCGFHLITARDLDRFGTQGIIDKIREQVGDSRIYITVDIDVLDPAFAPATGTPEAGGWTTRELLTILYGLEGLPLIGGDVVEVAPAYDTQAQVTALAAAEIAFSLVDLMVATPVKV